MSWENEYKSKLTTAEKAVELIKSGNRVVIGHAWRRAVLSGRRNGCKC